MAPVEGRCSRNPTAIENDDCWSTPPTWTVAEHGRLRRRMSLASCMACATALVNISESCACRLAKWLQDGPSVVIRGRHPHYSARATGSVLAGCPVLSSRAIIFRISDEISFVLCITHN